MQKLKNTNKSSLVIATPLGAIEGVADDNALYSVKFSQKAAGSDIKRQNVVNKLEEDVINPNASSTVLNSLKVQLEDYFAGKLLKFDLPLVFTGTLFQIQVWQALQTIKYGHTISYSELAYAIGNEKAVRAVALAVSSNLLSLVIPCHRVIGKSGALSGYHGGIARKKWLIEYEKS